MCVYVCMYVFKTLVDFFFEGGDDDKQRDICVGSVHIISSIIFMIKK